MRLALVDPRRLHIREHGDGKGQIAALIFGRGFSMFFAGDFECRRRFNAVAGTSRSGVFLIWWRPIEQVAEVGGSHVFHSAVPSSKAPQGLTDRKNIQEFQRNDSGWVYRTSD